MWADSELSTQQTQLILPSSYILDTFYTPMSATSHSRSPSYDPMTPTSGRISPSNDIVLASDIVSIANFYSNQPPAVAATIDPSRTAKSTSQSGSAESSKPQSERAPSESYTSPYGTDIRYSDAIVAQSSDPKRKFKCPKCPRAFARAYNLKTHIDTHDIDRAKPYVCHHKTCGRGFTRKHDLGRHIVAIHGREQSNGKRKGGEESDEESSSKRHRHR